MFEENISSANNMEDAELQTNDTDVTSEVVENTESAENSRQSVEDNARFAERMRKQELENTREQLNTANTRLADYEVLEKSLKAQGFTGSIVEIADQITANARGISIEDVRTERETLTQQDNLKNERDFYKNQINEIIINQDINKIKSKYPDIESLEDLPDGFVEIMATGKVKDPIIAYEMLRPQKEVPTSTGSLKSNDKQEKEYFTREEVKQMSKEQVHKNYEKIMASQKKW